jgi:cell division protein FtsB
MARRRRPSRSSLVLRWLAVAVLAAIAVAYVHPLRAYREARADVSQRREEIDALERENAALEQKLEFARTDVFVEREARRLGLVRPGERLFIVKGIEAWKNGRIR